jgi:hypothetical protein
MSHLREKLVSYHLQIHIMLLLREVLNTNSLLNFLKLEHDFIEDVEYASIRHKVEEALGPLVNVHALEG